MKKTTPTGKSRFSKNPVTPIEKKVAKTGRKIQSVVKKMSSKGKC